MERDGYLKRAICLILQYLFSLITVTVQTLAKCRQIMSRLIRLRKKNSILTDHFHHKLF